MNTQTVATSKKKKSTEAKVQSQAIKQALLAELRNLLPNEEEYLAIYVPFCAGIKYIYPDGRLGLFAASHDQVKPHYIDELPIESMVSLMEELEKRRNMEIQ